MTFDTYTILLVRHTTRLTKIGKKHSSAAIIILAIKPKPKRMTNSGASAINGIVCEVTKNGNIALRIVGYKQHKNMTTKLNRVANSRPAMLSEAVDITAIPISSTCVDR